VNLREGRAALKRQLDRLTEAYLGEVIPLAEYRRRRQELERKDEALEGQQRQLRTQADQRMELAGVAGSVEDFCNRVRAGLDDATFEQRRRLVELLIDRVIVTDDEVEIRYVIPTDPSSEHVRFLSFAYRLLRSPTGGAKAPRASSLRPPPLASLSSCLPERRSFLHDVVGPSPSQRDRGCSGRLRPGAYAKHLVALLGDALVRIAVPRSVGGRHQPQVGPYRAALFEAVGVLHGEHERERGERPDPFDPPQQIRFWVVLFRDRLQLSVVLADALG
jgi:hypothetical protein